MTLDYSKHKNILLQILKDIYSDTSIAPHLGFKGGTATMMFYDLPRHSVDLDFDLLDETKENEVFEKINQIVATYGKITESYMQKSNLKNVVSYEANAQQIKVEVNLRKFGSKYEMKTYLGISMLVMVKEDMFAHKLMAMIERIGKTSRDIFDVQYFAKNNWPINRRLSRTDLVFLIRTLWKKPLNNWSRWITNIFWMDWVNYCRIHRKIQLVQS